MNNENNLHLIKICEKLDKLQQSVNQLQKDVEILKPAWEIPNKMCLQLQRGDFQDSWFC